MTTATEIKTSAPLESVNLFLPHPSNQARDLDAGFLASIKEEGLLQPIIARPHPENDGMFQIVCGHRRVAAFNELDIAEIPAFIRDMTDEQVRRAMFIENKFREGLNPWQEATFIAEYIEDGMDVPAIAATLDMTVGQVRRRAKLLNLSPAWREEIGGDNYSFKKWIMPMFERIASFEDARMQEHLHEEIEAEACSDWTLADLDSFLADQLLALKAAPWDLEDATLVPSAGSCAACPNRSDAQADLFGDVAGLVKGGARCLDSGCFKVKQTAYIERRKDELEEKNPGLQVVSKSYTGDSTALQPNQWEPAKKSDAGSVPAMDIATGDKIWVKPTGAKQPEGPGRKKLDENGRREQHEARRRALTIEKLIKYIEADDLVFDGKHAREILVGYCLTYGVAVRDGMAIDLKAETRYAKGETEYTIDRIWEAVVEDMADKLGDVLRSGIVKLDYDIVKLCAWMVDADLKALKARADEDLPLPISLGGPGGKRAKPAPAQGQAAEEEEDALWPLGDDDGEDAE